jgi:membrane-associated phospholipid phosphatase
MPLTTRLRRADQAAIAALPDLRTARCTILARAASKLADRPVSGGVLVLATVVSARRGSWRAAAVPALVVPAGMITRWLTSEAIARPPPPADLWLAEPEGHSMPSRHTTLAVLTAGAALAAADADELLSQMAMLLAGVTVGSSRVYLGVHWPSDVIAGWLFGRGGCTPPAGSASARKGGSVRCFAGP